MGDFKDEWLEEAAAARKLPYAVEYAKTGRSSCKKCRETIAQGSMRISAREPSRFFDGLQDNWHHYSCFWKALKSGDINERSIRGFDWLKWEDQELLRKRIQEHTGLTAKEEPQGDAAELKFASIRVEYAKTARGKCSGCSKTIDKKVMKYGWKGKFYHFECIFLADRCFQGEVDEIQGFPLLSDGDREMLQTALSVFSKKTQETKDALFAADLAKTTALEEEEKALMNNIGAPAQKRPKIEEIKSPEEIKQEKLKKQSELLWQLREGFQKRLTKQQMQYLLKANNQEVPAGMDKILDRLTDCALFGRPVRCVKCPQGLLHFSTSRQTYVCSGHVSDWTKCTWHSRLPPRTKFGIPRDMADEIPWLVTDAPINRLTERTYNDSNEQIVSPSKSFRHLGAGRADEGDLEMGYKNKSTIGKSIVKNGTAVDCAFEYSQVVTVQRDEDGSLFTVSLCSADMATNQNSFYKMQLLKHDYNKTWYVFRSWGRVGTAQGGQTSNQFKTLEKAKEHFAEIFLEKTGNRWADKKYFRKKPGCLNLVETVDDVHIDTETVEPGSITTLPRPIVDVLKMIFDTKQMMDDLKEYDIDTDRMPLGKLSEAQIRKAYQVLQELQELIGSGEADRDRVLDATNRFYTLIPHNSGQHAPQMLNNEKVIREKCAMLDSLLEVTFAFNLLKQEAAKKNVQKRDPVDKHYEQLKTYMEVLGHDSDEFRMVVDYATKTHGHTHMAFKVEILEVIKITREGEEAKFKKELGNRMLLWHGSGKSNFAGILAQGLRIAPPEAPASGYMFGKGIYFADMFSKSANYCRTRGDGDPGLLLLADVALGKMTLECQAKGHSAQTMRKLGTTSCMGVGITLPDPQTHITHSDGYRIPVGMPTQRQNMSIDPLFVNGPSLQYNEYIVYDVNQINLKYLVHARFFRNI